MPINQQSRPFLLMYPKFRLGISLIVTFITILFTYHLFLHKFLLLVLWWDVFAISFITTSLMAFFNCSTQQMRQRAQEEDGSRMFVFLLILVSAIAGMVIVLLLILSKDATDKVAVYLPIAIAGMILSWSMIHVTYTFHYAHLYYDNDDGNEAQSQDQGMSFPEETQPAYLDFAYFAFVIGMTFQVSDVQITSRKIRRQALAHSLLAFAMNTFVVALTINIIAGLKG